MRYMAENEMFICLVLCMSSDAFNGQSAPSSCFLRTNSFSTTRMIQSWKKQDSVRRLTILIIKDVNKL